MRARRTDTTQREIVMALRGVGWLVWPINGAVDLAVAVDGDVYLVDCKTGVHATLTATQRQMIADGWPLILATGGQDAVDKIAARRRGT